MSKMSYHLLCHNYQKIHQNYLTATASKQGDRVLVLFPDAVGSGSSSLHFTLHSLMIFHPFQVPITVQNPSSLSSQELCHIHLGIKPYFLLLVL